MAFFPPAVSRLVSLSLKANMPLRLTQQIAHKVFSPLPTEELLGKRAIEAFNIRAKFGVPQRLIRDAYNVMKRESAVQSRLRAAPQGEPLDPTLFTPTTAKLKSRLQLVFRVSVRTEDGLIEDRFFSLRKNVIPTVEQAMIEFGRKLERLSDAERAERYPGLSEFLDAVIIAVRTKVR